MSPTRQPTHVDILKRGSREWNKWRRMNPGVRPQPRRADLRRCVLRGVDLSDADLRDAQLQRANLRKIRAVNAQFQGAVLRSADLRGAVLTGADLSDTDLRQVILVDTNLAGTRLNQACVYGISVWDVSLDGAEQNDLVITPQRESIITVDNLEVAQFIYLLVNNKRLRSVIDTICSKVVLILGRFTPERKELLDAIRRVLRDRNYSPVMFDFSPPQSRDLTETAVSTLAHLARFVIADITDAKSIPQELERIVPGLPSVPVQPILHASDREYGMFEHFRRYPWVLDVSVYENLNDLLSLLDGTLVPRAESAREQSLPRNPT